MAKSSKEVYLELVDELEEELEDSEIIKLKNHLKDAQFGGFRPGELSRTDSCRDILTNLLERKGIIGPGNYSTLKELMKKIKNQPAVDLISKAEEVSGIQSSAKKRKKTQEDAITYEMEENERFNNSYNMMPGGGCPCVILVKNTLSRGEPERSEEEGARLKDANNLKEIFVDMKCDIWEFENLSKKEFIEILQNKLTGDLKYRNYTALFIIMISHGNEKGIQMCPDSDEPDTYDMFVEVKDIEERINSDNLPKMKGKPKVILVQACRKPVTRPDGATAADNDSIVDLPACYTHLPVNADILIAYATSESCLAFRDKDEGSWFINEFCKVVREDSRRDHLLELLTTLNRKVAERRENDQQMPTFASTFTKKFFLTL